jgi:hypothetical protein
MIKRVTLLIVVLVLFFTSSGCSQYGHNQKDKEISNSQLPTVTENKSSSEKNTSLEISSNPEFKIYTQTAPNNGVIPFLTFTINESNKYWHYVEAYLNYLDTKQGKIMTTDKPLYIVTAPPTGGSDWSLPIHHFGPPLSWDGKNYLYLSSRVHKPENIPSFLKLKMFDDPRVPATYSNGIEHKFDYVYAYSEFLQEQEKNIGSNYLKERYGDFTFRVFDKDGNLLIEKNVHISLYNDVFNGGVSSGEGYLCDPNIGLVKELFLYFNNDGGHFLICTVDLKNGTYKWDEVKGIKGCVPYIGRNRVAIINGKFYVPLCAAHIGIIDPNDYSSRIIDVKQIFNSLSFYNAPIAFQEDSPLDEYENFLVIRGTVILGKSKEGDLPEHVKHLWILYDTEKNRVVQLLEWDSFAPRFILVRDTNGKELSRMETPTLIKNSDKIKWQNGEPLMNGGFVYENCIRFPHKNGG